MSRVKAATKSRASKVLGVTLLCLTVSGGIAQAASVSTTGSKAWNSGTYGRTLNVEDTQSEGDAAYANWNSSGNNRIQTASGKGNTASIKVNPLNNFRACRDQGSLNPDNCSSWVTP
ncbi:hypothetical protein Kisp01_64060 [Kineosporia sp. NBRC 101677]|nr:hypothetical protein Kisp01_64060 [Kineosporia sp. NBRC 101677]